MPLIPRLYKLYGLWTSSFCTGLIVYTSVYNIDVIAFVIIKRSMNISEYTDEQVTATVTPNL